MPLTKEQKAVLAARERLAEFLRTQVLNENDRAEIGRRIGVYVAAAIREDRVKVPEPSLFERTFGPSFLRNR